MSPWSVFSLRTLRGKLIVTSVLLVTGALALASGVFVVLMHGQEKQRALDHTVATAPIIHGEFLQRLLDGDSLSQLQEYVRGAAADHDVRILMFDYSGQVVQDTGGGLSGTQLDISESPEPPGPQHDSYRTWQLQGVAGEDSIVLVSPFPALTSRGQRISIPPPSDGAATDQGPTAAQELVPPYRLAVVVPEDTIARAWLHLLPWLALAAGIALPAAVGSAIVISRNITRPLSQLTAAADQMSRGAFDIDVSTDRADEVGQLSRSFSSMAQNVGETHSQMRELLANVSHDMRTPLTSILGFAQALRGGVITGEAESKHAGDVIYDEVSKLSERLDDLLFLSEIEAGQALVECEDVDLPALVSAAVERTAVGAEERSVAVTCDLPPDMHASVDRAKLERALENLLENARKFTPNGGDIHVRAFRDDDGQSCVEVANTATDIDAEELPRLFERFYRRDRARTGRSAGSGLGLTIARDLVELHGGRLEAHLVDGTVTFRMTLPPSPDLSA
jgi:signal transduction histidine kinase